MKNNSKKNGMFCVVAAAALLLGGCAQGQGKMAYIGADAAKKQILAEVGLDESQVKINSVDMATKNGMDYYRVEFSDENGNTYRYDIEALTGKVIESAAGDAADVTAAETTAAAAEAGMETTAAAAETGAEATAAAAEAGMETTAAAAEAGAETTAAAAEAETKTTVAAAETIAVAVPGTTAAAEKADSGSAARLTAEEAKTKALAHAGLSASEVTFIKAQLDWDDGKQVYDVEFYGSNMTEYDYEVDAATGAILSVDKDREAAQRPTQAAVVNGAAQSAVNNTTQAAAAGSKDAGTQAAQQQTTQAAAAGSAKITLEEAKAKALAHAGLSNSQMITFMKAELDRDDGKQIYDVEFYGNDGTEYDYEIDAFTGAVLKYDVEAPKGNASAPYTVTNNLSADDAKALALQQVPGATLNDIAEFETDREDGRIEYEGKIYYGGMEYEFEIDGYSGAFRKWECEHDDDHH